jgi:hypothetical protein
MGAAARIAYGQNCLRMSFATGALGAAAGVRGGALDEGATQNFACCGKAFAEPLTRLDGLRMCHLDISSPEEVNTFL